ncbi:hypothetical protein [Nocardioides sp. Leaf285]|uniref:hypothetical protein n=1 Tax=Nocardioides sp. Leaf285 TaxID=1736322 RepID=UPI0007026EF9|nr:hypothetical protein [Nocardioides sp. Leaf285]KQP62927.1 hypothetical protein ASF47_18110 [Nocardioides sp. Leaf285]
MSRQPTTGPADAAGWVCWRDARHRVGVRETLGWPQCRDCAAAPAYHERPSYLPHGFTLNVYVPSENERGQRLRRTLAPGSAIVGVADDPEVYFEGWTFGQHDITTIEGWGAGVLHAASRLVTAYPTIARASVAGTALLTVARFDPRTSNLDVTDDDTLLAWLQSGKAGS